MVIAQASHSAQRWLKRPNMVRAIVGQNALVALAAREPGKYRDSAPPDPFFGSGSGGLGHDSVPHSRRPHLLRSPPKSASDAAGGSHGGLGSRPPASSQRHFLDDERSAGKAY